MSARYTADDFGLHESSDRAALELSRAGALDAVSVLVTALDEPGRARVRTLAELPRLSIGLHLDLTEGVALTRPARLVGAAGSFLGLRGLLREAARGALRRGELAAEIAAQWAALEALAGRVDYVDGHQHVQFLPVVLDALSDVMRARGAHVPVRLGQLRAGLADPRSALLTPLSVLATRRHAELSSTGELVRDYDALAHAEAAGCEVMLHPAHPEVPAAELDGTSYGYPERVGQYLRRRCEAERGVRVELVRSQGERERARSYAEQHAQASFGHTRAYAAAVREAYGLAERTLVAYRGDIIVGVAPFTRMAGTLGVPYWVIAPFASYGDVLADDWELRALLIAESRRQAQRERVGHLHVRSRYATEPLGALGAQETAVRFVSPRVPIARDLEAQFSRVTQSRGRNTLRKVRKLDVRAERVAPDSADFRAVFAEGMRALGSPFHGARFFGALARQFGPQLVSWVAYHQGRRAAAALAIEHAGTLHYVYGQNVHAERESHANSLLIWQMLEHAHARGLGFLDMGRSECGSSQLRFKEQWGAVPVPLLDSRIPVRRGSLPDLNPTNPRFALAQNVWRRLPVALTSRLGPLVIRGIG
jgi:FemAB-related protein (PEP-CTERM system-associated)